MDKENVSPRRKKRAALMLWALLIFTALVSGCKTAAAKAVEGAGRLMDGSAFRERTLETWTARQGGPLDQGLVIRRVLRRKDQKEYYLVTPRAFPAFTFRAVSPAGEPGRLVFESLEFLGSHVEGYTEMSRDIFGGGFFRSDGYAGFFALEPGLMVLDIRAGWIRRNTVRLSGEAALGALHNRDERIAALIRWMGPESDPGGPRFPDRAAFARHWEPLLFPELARPSLRPPAWAGALPAEWRQGEDIKWNSAYTRAVFPEELWPVRDSGTLLRDWEEALEWIYYQFEWSYIIHTLTGENSFSGGVVRLVKN